MNTITNDWLLEASRWLWDYFLLATVLLAVVLVLGKFLAQPARRMAVHWSTAAGLVLLALLCAVPGWSVVNLLSAPSEPPTVWVENLGPDISAGYPPQTKPMALSFVQESPIDLPTDSTTPIYAAQRIITIDWAVLSLYAVAVGSFLFSLWLALGHWQMRRLRSQAKPAPPELEALLPQFIPTGQRTPSLGIVAKLPVAAAVGLRRPMVLLPQNFLELADPEKLQSEKIQTVLAHELAHIRHRDLWLLALLRGLLLVLWPHPLYWLWRRGVRLDQETLADAAAADITDRTHYAEQLVAWARETASEVRRRPLASSVGLWESPSQLKRRIAILLDEKLTVLRACSHRWRVGSALGMLAIAGGLSLITLSPAEPQVALAENGDPTESDDTLSTSEDKTDSDVPSKADNKKFSQYTFLEGLQIAADEGVLVRLDPQRLAHNPMIPDELSVHAAYQFNPRNVIAKLKIPFDDRAGYKDAFANVLQGLEKDPYGPQVNIERELLPNLTGLITVLTFEQDADVKEPQQWLVAVQTRNKSSIYMIVKRLMSIDPNASLMKMQDWPAWKIVNEQAESSFVSVVMGHLFVSNDAELMQKVFAKNPKAKAP